VAHVAHVAAASEPAKQYETVCREIIERLLCFAATFANGAHATGLLIESGHDSFRCLTVSLFHFRKWLVPTEALPVRADLRPNESIGDFLHGDSIPIEGCFFATGLPHGKDEYGVGILLIGKLGLDGIDCA
jgi:hypothetical protein